MHKKQIATDIGYFTSNLDQGWNSAPYLQDTDTVSDTYTDRDSDTYSNAYADNGADAYSDSDANTD